MMEGTNLKVKEFENVICGIANGSDLPAEVKRLVFENMAIKLEAQANMQISIELQQKNAQAANSGEETKNDSSQKESESNPGESAGKNQGKSV